MFRNSITSTPFVGDVADSVFGKISGSNFRGDVSFISSLRALVFPRMDKEGLGLYFDYKERNYTSRDLAGVRAERAVRAVLGFYSDDVPQNAISVINFNGYSSEDNCVAISTIEKYILEHIPGFTKINKITEFFSKKFHAVCFINQEQKTSVVLCDCLDMRKFHYLQFAIPVMLPWYFDPEAGVSQEELDVLQSLRGKEHVKYLDALAKIAKKYDFRAIKIRNELSNFETRFLNKEIQSLTRSIESKMRDVKIYEENISSLMQQCYDCNIKLMGLNAKIAEGTVESEITEYFICNKNLYLIEVNDSMLSFSCKGYLEYYDEEIIKKYLSNKNSVVYRPDGRDLSRIFSRDDIKMLMTALFIDQELRMKFCATFEFDLRGSVRPRGRRQYGSDFSDSTPNTHLDRFECLGNNKRYINEKLSKGDYIGAIEQSMSACKGLNFADSPVISEFMSRMYGISAYDVNMRCIELPDGTVVEPKDAVKWLKERNEQKKKQEEAKAKAPEVKEE